MIEKIFDVNDKIKHNKEKKYLTIVVDKEQVKILKSILDKVVKIYDCDVVHKLDCDIVSLVMNRDRYLKFLDSITSSGYALFAFPSTRILYTLIKM